MAIKIQGTDVINDDRELKNITNADNIIQQPTNQTPADGATDIGASTLSLTLATSSYNDLYGGQGSVRFQVSDTSDFSSIVIDETIVSTTTNSYTIDDIRIDLTDGETTYYWRSQYQDVNGKTSLFSDPFTFVTALTFPEVDKPAITSPSDGATDIGESPTITSSSFSTTGVSDTHESSDWEIATDSSFSNIVYQSLNDTSNLESIVVPAGVLSDNQTTYYVRVRHTGVNLNVSEYSDVVSFTTTDVFFVPAITSNNGFNTDNNNSNVVYEFENYNDIVTSPDGSSVYAVGRQPYFAQPSDFNNSTMATFYEFDKNLNFVKTFSISAINASGGDEFTVFSMNVLNNGNIVLVGSYSFGEAVIVIIDPVSETIIAQTAYQDDNNEIDRYARIIQHSNSNIIFTAGMTVGGGATVYYIASFDSTDLSVINEAYVDTGSGEFNDCIEDNDGNIVAVAADSNIEPNNNSEVGLLIKFDPSDLSIIQSAVYETSGSRTTFDRISLDNDGNYILTGLHNTSNTDGYHFTTVNSSNLSVIGNKSKAFRRDPNTDYEFRVIDVIQLQSGNYVIFAQTRSFNGIEPRGAAFLLYNSSLTLSDTILLEHATETYGIQLGSGRDESKLIENSTGDIIAGIQSEDLEGAIILSVDVVGNLFNFTTSFSNHPNLNPQTGFFPIVSEFGNSLTNNNQSLSSISFTSGFDSGDVLQLGVDDNLYTESITRSEY